MTERKRESVESVEVRPLELAVEKDGFSITIETRSSSKEAYEEFRNLVKSAGYNFVGDDKDERSSSSFFFGSWNGSKWQPEGPKPNWRVPPPKDPRAN